MMIRKPVIRKTLACFFLCLTTSDLLLPTAVKALTSGPKQPEMTQFQPAGMSDMVDLFTGDFKYNIPLLDVDGYPVNLNYSQGVGMDDEASWVGLGWNLNVGTLNRALRGVPDDHMGDKVEVITHMKPKVTTGGSFRARMEIFGNNAVKVGGSLSLGVFYDNYTGYGAEFGAGLNAGLSLTGKNAGKGTLGLDAGINSHTTGGVSPTLGASLSYTQDIQSVQVRQAGSLNFGYNTREGMQELTLKSSTKFDGSTDRAGESASISLNTPTFYPAGEIPFRNTSRTYTADLGGVITAVNLSLGATGYKTVRELQSNNLVNYAYGSMYSHKGKNEPQALMDFMREDDNIVIKDMNHIALPIATPDLWNYTSQAGSGQFKIYNGGSGVFFNNRKQDVSDNQTLGADIGFGLYLHGGVSLYNQAIYDRSQKWTSDNEFLPYGDYPEPSNTTGEEHAYFKSVGEHTIENPNFARVIKQELPVSIPLKKKAAQNGLKVPGEVFNETSPENIKKQGRQNRNTAINYLTAEEAAFAGLDKRITSYNVNDIDSFTPQNCAQMTNTKIGRVSGVRKRHHISEVSVTGTDGKRLVYGIPVYNNFQKEISFAVKQGLQQESNLVKYKKEGTRIKHKYEGTNEYYFEQTQPGYAPSYLLTGILSPDYADLTGNGITDDDRGTAIKFNYSRITDRYKWRTPYKQGYATLNKGLLADTADDKASIVYGEKEIWYPHSIETKTKIAYFITQDRDDALGVKNVDGELEPAVKQKRLVEIRLYSKSDLSKPIKVVKLEYAYELCQNTPNSLATGKGKLMLRTVSFNYNGSTRGDFHYYKFQYKEQNTPAGNYAFLSSDRWGTVKSPAPYNNMLNDEYPYTRATFPDRWLLNRIELPTGGVIEVNYEEDTYSYVQNRKAMAMDSWPVMLNDTGNVTSDLTEMRWMRFAKPQGLNISTVEDFCEHFLSGSRYLYGKVYTNLTDEPNQTVEGYFDWVPCYAEVSGISVSENNIDVEFVGKTVSGKTINPFALAAWQRMRLDYPRYAYPGYKNKIPDTEALDAALQALGSAIGNIREITEDFNERALRKEFAKNIKPEKSFVRLTKMDKAGGGARVKSLVTREVWDGGPEEASIQQYTYTTRTNDGRTVSSGVASYEPSVGGDENPWRQPDPYTQVNRMALNNEYHLEEPFGEALFPSPSVGYSEVRVESRSGRDIEGQTSQTGYLQYEFYTAKEFPVEIENTPLEKYERKPAKLSMMFGGNAIYEMALSQGYLIRINDMHGKPKAERVFNQVGKEIAATEYYYNTEERGGAMRLVNKADVVDEHGNITKDQILGRELEIFVDAREAETSNHGTSVNIGFDVIPLFGYPIPVPHFPIQLNNEYRLFRSVSVTKTVQYFGIPNRIVKKADGSSVTTYNLLFDKNTGAPVVTATENEFNDPVYSLNIPAYWVYPRMGHAYRTSNMIFRDLVVDPNGTVDATFRNLMIPGDELSDLNRPDRRLWVVNTPLTPGGTPIIRLIDSEGKLVKNISRATFKVIRSGNRNQTGLSAGSIVSLKKPYNDSRLLTSLNISLGLLNILDAKAVLYAEDWGVQAECTPKLCPEGYVLSADGTRCLLPATVDPAETGTNGLLLKDKRRTGNPPQNYSYSSYFLDDNNNVLANRGGPFWGASEPVYRRLNSCAVWVGNETLGQWFRLIKDFAVTREGLYTIGFAADDAFRIRINGESILNRDALSASNYQDWYVKQVYLKEGYNRLTLEFANYSDQDGSAAGWELYDHSMQELLALPENERPNILLSTDGIREYGYSEYQTFRIDATGNVMQGSLYHCSPSPFFPYTDERMPYCVGIPVGECPPGYVKSADGLSCVLPSTINPEQKLTLKSFAGTALPGMFSINGAEIRDMAGNPVVNANSCFFGKAHGGTACGRLKNAGVWVNDYTSLGGAKVGIRACFTVDEAGSYYIGSGATGGLEVRIDGTLVSTLSSAYLNDNENINNPTTYWHVKSVTLAAGKHEIDILGEARVYDPNSGGGGEARMQLMASGESPLMGVDIYKATEYELLNYQGETGPPMIFSTSLLTMPGAMYDTYIKSSGGAVTHRRWTCNGSPADVCEQCSVIKMSRVINPYITGYLGNWRAMEEKVFLTDRNETPRSTNVPFVRNSGGYKYFTPFWHYAGKWMPSNNPGWVTARWITAYDSYSQELENKNALQQYTGTRFGYKETLPVILGSNARSRELYYDGFEDYKYNGTCTPVPCKLDYFDIRKLAGTDYETWLDATQSHSGNYCLKLGSPVLLKTQAFLNEHGPGQYIETNSAGEYQRKLDPWLGLFGFNPVTGRRYIISLWVKDINPENTTFDVKLKVNQHELGGTYKATVEGWKLVEFEWDLSQHNTDNMWPIPVELSAANASTRVDDIRIFPHDGQAVTYAYDEKTLRLMAELDANNFATFYEYDDEGNLIRVKKETEKGIITIKESRSTYQKKSL